MTLSVIGSGFDRTGTKSLKIALEQLGLGPCHHMEEVADHPEQLDGWRVAAKGEPVNWQDIYAGYRSTVDWPGAHYWRELAEAYPDAKVIHTTRPSEKWWASFSNTIAKILTEIGSGDISQEIETIPEMAHAIVAEQTFGGRCADKDVALEAFEKRQADVLSSIDAERLLVFEVSQGWEPLCEFLGVPVPGEAFPRSNNREEFWDIVQKMEPETG